IHPHRKPRLSGEYDAGGLSGMRASQRLSIYFHEVEEEALALSERLLHRLLEPLVPMISMAHTSCASCEAIFSMNLSSTS
ncbi:MAG: hypothetical protein ACXW4A_02235, partial [Nitrospira sp.]